MASASMYFRLGCMEEIVGNEASALLFYLSSFCSSYNSNFRERPSGTVRRIRSLQNSIGLTDDQLLCMVRSYGILTDLECQYLLYYSIYGFDDGIHAVIYGSFGP